MTNETDGSMYRTYSENNIPFSKCKVGKNIHYENTAELEEYGIENYYCPDFDNLTI